LDEGARRLAFTATLWNINTHLSVRKMKMIIPIYPDHADDDAVPVETTCDDCVVFTKTFQVSFGCSGAWLWAEPRQNLPLLSALSHYGKDSLRLQNSFGHIRYALMMIGIYSVLGVQPSLSAKMKPDETCASARTWTTVEIRLGFGKCRMSTSE